MRAHPFGLIPPDPWPKCEVCERRIRLDYIDSGGVARYRHEDGTPACTKDEESDDD